MAWVPNNLSKEKFNPIISTLLTSILSVYVFGNESSTVHFSFSCLLKTVKYLNIHVELKLDLYTQGAAKLVKDASCWQLDHEWRQDIAVVTKWLSGVSPVCSSIFIFAVVSY